MGWVDSLKKEWSSIATVVCLITVGLIEAWQQATSGLPVGRLPRLSGGWNYVPLAFLIAAGVAWLLGRPSRKALIPQAQPAQSAGIIPGIPTLSALQGQAPQITFNAQEWFRLAYYSPITAELENNIKVIAHNAQPQNHEAFYARFIGVGIAAYMHDITWAYIFKSQLSLLAELNRRITMPPADAKKYYDAVVPLYPKLYPKYSFDQWLGYMKNEQLVIQHPSQMLEITHRGRDFLRYLAHFGRDTKVKSC